MGIFSNRHESPIVVRLANVTKWDSIGLGLMGALGNLDHERFCQAAHKRIWGGEQRAEALRAAYLETIYSGDNPENRSVGDKVPQAGQPETG